MKVDPQTLATGYRASKVVGATVVNEADPDYTRGPEPEEPLAVLRPPA